MALIIKPNTFEKLSKASNFKEKSDIKRIDIINVIFDKIKKKQKLSRLLAITLENSIK